jgi:hypothetical protein
MHCLINSLLISKYLFHTMNILFYILSFVNITVYYIMDAATITPVVVAHVVKRFLFVCTESLTLVSDPTSHRFIRCSLFQTFLYIYRCIYIYVWKLNQTVLELDFRAVKFLFFPRRNLNPQNLHHLSCMFVFNYCLYFTLRHVLCIM